MLNVVTRLLYDKSNNIILKYSEVVRARCCVTGPFAAPFSRSSYLHYCACVNTPHTNVWCRYSNLSTGAGTVDTAFYFVFFGLYSSPDAECSDSVVV